MYTWSLKNWNVAPLIPPVDHTSPPTRPVVKDPRLAWRGGLGSGSAAEVHVPLGQPEMSRLSTAVVESKNPPPLVSPPIAYSVLPEFAIARSDRAGVNVGPVDHVPVDMSSRIVVLRFVPGLAAPQPPTMYRYWPTVW